MAFFNEFPHTRTYDSDLAWLIKRMKEVLSRMDSVEARMSALEQLVKDFIATLDIDKAIKDALQDMVDNGVFDDLLRNLFTQYSQTIDNKITNIESRLNQIVNEFITNVTNRLNAIETSLINYYTKNEIDNMLGGLSDLITDLDNKIINSASKARAIIEVSGGSLTRYEYVLGTVSTLRGRINITSASNNFIAMEHDSNSDVIQKITLFDEVHENLNIPITSFYDLCDISGAVSITYSGLMNTSLPPYSGYGALSTGSMAINHKVRTGNNMFLRGYPMTGSPTFVMLLGLIQNVNELSADRGFPSNDAIRTLLPTP